MDPISVVRFSIESVAFKIGFCESALKHEIEFDLFVGILLPMTYCFIFLGGCRFAGSETRQSQVATGCRLVIHLIISNRF